MRGGLAMATSMTLNSLCCGRGIPKSEAVSLSRLPVTSTNNDSSSVALSTRSRCIGRVEFGQTSRRRITRNVEVFGRRGSSGGRPTKPIPSYGTSSRGRSSPVQQETEFQAKKTRQEEDDEDDALAEAALEALFAQLEKDLEDGAMAEDDDGNEDFTEEEVIALEDELEAALRGIDYNQGTAIGEKSEGDASTTERLTKKDDELLLDDGQEDEEEQRIVSLETWQLRKLAAAVEIGRRHVNVKALSAELGMDRSDVLAWLKNPPPELLMLGASMELEDESEEADPLGQEFQGTPVRSSSKDSRSSTKQNLESEGLGPVTWHSQKRLRKEHIATFERVFRGTRRPTNTMIQNLVELTHVPRKRIVEWFEHKRQEVEPSRSFESLR